MEEKIILPDNICDTLKTYIIISYEDINIYITLYIAVLLYSGAVGNDWGIVNLIKNALTSLVLSHMSIKLILAIRSS